METEIRTLLNLSDDKLLTPLVFLDVVRHPNVTCEMLQYITQHIANINSVYNLDQTLFDYLCLNSNVTPEMQKLMIDNGANVNSDYNVDTNYQVPMRSSFYHLCCNKNVTTNMIKVMLDSGAQISYTSGVYRLLHPMSALCSNPSVNLEMLELMINSVGGIDNLYDVNHYVMFLKTNKKATKEMIDLLKSSKHYNPSRYVSALDDHRGSVTLVL